MPAHSSGSSLDVTSAKYFHFFWTKLTIPSPVLSYHCYFTPLGRTWSVLLLFLCSKLSLYFSPSDRTWHIVGSLNMLTKWKNYINIYEVFQNMSIFQIYIYLFIYIFFQIVYVLKLFLLPFQRKVYLIHIWLAPVLLALYRFTSMSVFSDKLWRLWTQIIILISLNFLSPFFFSTLL